MKYYPKGWHTYKFLVTPQELKDILRGFHIVIYNRRVPADYIESNFANFVRDYESFYRFIIRKTKNSSFKNEKSKKEVDVTITVSNKDII